MTLSFNHVQLQGNEACASHESVHVHARRQPSTQKWRAQLYSKLYKGEVYTVHIVRRPKCEDQIPNSWTNTSGELQNYAGDEGIDWFLHGKTAHFHSKALQNTSKSSKLPQGGGTKRAWRSNMDIVPWRNVVFQQLLCSKIDLWTHHNQPSNLIGLSMAWLSLCAPGPEVSHFEYRNPHRARTYFHPAPIAVTSRKQRRSQLDIAGTEIYLGFQT